MKTLKSQELLNYSRIKYSLDEICKYIVDCFKKATLEYDDNGEKIIFRTMVDKNTCVTNINFNEERKIVTITCGANFHGYNNYEIPFHIFEEEHLIENFIKEKIDEWKEYNQTVLKSQIEYYINKKQETEKKEYAEYLRLKEKFDTRKKEKIEDVDSVEHLAFNQALDVLLKLKAIDSTQKDKISEHKDWRLLLKDFGNLCKELTKVKEILEKE